MGYVMVAIGVALWAYLIWYANHVVRIGMNNKQWQTYCELKQMSDRELSDIGLTRGDIYSVAKDVKE